MKEVGFVDTTLLNNVQHDVVWSYDFSFVNSSAEWAMGSYLLVGPATLYEATYGTELTIGTTADSIILTDPEGVILTDEDGITPLTDEDDDSVTYIPPHLSIVFDSTGLNALSSANRSGVGMSSIKPESVIVRNLSDDIVYYESLSSIDPDFEIDAGVDKFRSFRFVLTDRGKTLHIDSSIDNNYDRLVSIDIGSRVDDYTTCHTGFAYTSPVNGGSTTGLMMKNMHTYGDPTSYEIVTNDFVPLTSDMNVDYTFVPNVTANKK